MWHECITYPEDPPEVYSEPEPTTQYYHTQTFVGRRELISQNCSSVSLPHAIKPFGAIADVGNRFWLAATVIFLPASIAVVVLLWLLPETRGREPEQLWP